MKGIPLRRDPELQARTSPKFTPLVRETSRGSPERRALRRITVSGEVNFAALA